MSDLVDACPLPCATLHRHGKPPDADSVYTYATVVGVLMSLMLVLVSVVSGSTVPANYRVASPPVLDPVPARRLRRMLSTPTGAADSPELSLLQDVTSSFPSEDESRAEWLELRHLQADLDERSKKFHARQYAADGEAKDQSVSAKQLTPSPARRRSSAEGTPIRTPGRAGQLVHAAGRELHERAAPLGRDFWIELKGAVYGVSRIDTQVYVDEQQRAILADTVSDVIDFESSDTGGHQAKGLLGRLASVSNPT